MPYFEDKKNFRSWWQSRTGLEQKLVILSTVLFILAFSLTISVIVIKNRSPAAPPAATTVSGEPTGSTASVTVTEDASSTASSPVTEAASSTASSTVTADAGSTVSSTVTEDASSTASSTVTEKASSTASSPATKDASSPASSTVTGEASSTASTTVPEVPTTSENPPQEEKLLAPGSINNRPARYISPRALANLNGA